MEKQISSVVEVGELWLFLIGIVASVLLLVILLIPFMSRILIPTQLWVRGCELSDELLIKLIAHLRRDGFELINEERNEAGERTRLSLRADSVTYVITLSSEGVGWRAAISSDSVDLSRGEPLSILSSAGPGWFLLRLERHLLRCAGSAELSWGAPGEEEGSRARPLGPLARYSVTIAPWR